MKHWSIRRRRPLRAAHTAGVCVLLVTGLPTAAGDVRPVSTSSAACAAAELTAPVPSLQHVASREFIEVSTIRLADYTVLDEQEVRAVIGAYERQSISNEALQELRFRLSQLYLQKGYVNSGVVIPDQQVEHGEILLCAVEGALTDIEITGNKRIRSAYFTRLIEREADDVLNVNVLQNTLQRIQQDPLVRQVNARLLPGARPGESELEVRVREHAAYELGVRADNHRAASVGEERARLTFTHRNLSGNRDALTFDVGYTEGVQDGFAAYRLPITTRNTVLEIYAGTDDTEIIEKPFDQLDIKTETDSFGLSVTHPVLRRPNSSVVATVGLYNKRSESTLLDVPFSFNRGDDRGRSEVSVLPISAEWSGRVGKQAFSLRGGLRFGLDLLDSTINPEPPDSEFVAFLGQLQYVRRLDWRQTELDISTSFQLAGDPLLAIEKFPVGGAGSVRGYRENQFVRDNGAVVSIEARIPVLRDPSVPKLANFRFVPFFDYGRSWDEDNRLATSDAEDIYSLGVGLTWDPSPLLRAELYYGQALRDVDNPTDSLQNRGWHFSVNFTVPIGRGSYF